MRAFSCNAQRDPPRIDGPAGGLVAFFPPTSAQKVVRTWTGSEKRIEKTYVTVYVPYWKVNRNCSTNISPVFIVGIVCWHCDDVRILLTKLRSAEPRTPVTTACTPLPAPLRPWRNAATGSGRPSPRIPSARLCWRAASPCPC